MPQAVARSGRQFDPDELNYLRMLQERQPVPNELERAGAGPYTAEMPIGQYGPPSPDTIQFPIGRYGETETRAVPTSTSPSAPRNALQSLYDDVTGHFGKMANDVVKDPWGAFVQGPMEFLGAGAGSHAMGTGARTLARGGPWRAATEAESDALKAAHRSEDIAQSRAPHYGAQTRGPKGKPGAGQFKKLDAETKAARERGIAARTENQRAAEYAAKRSAEDAENARRINERLRDPRYMEETARFRRNNPPDDYLIKYRGKPPKRL